VINKGRELAIEAGKAVTGDDHWFERLDKYSQRTYTCNALAGTLGLALVGLMGVIIVLENIFTPLKVGIVRAIPIALFIVSNKGVKPGTDRRNARNVRLLNLSA
jgi:hypothetical protein